MKPGRLFLPDRSLWYKFVLLSVTPVVLITALVMLFVVPALQNHMISEAKAKIRAVTELTKLSMSNSLAIYKKNLVDSFINSLAGEQNINYAVLVNAGDNRIISHSDHKLDSGLYKVAIPRKTSGTSVRANPSDLTETGRMTVPIVIGGRTYGWLEVGYSLKGVYQKITDIQYAIFGFAGIALLVCVFLSTILAGIIDKPIMDMADQAGQIGAGDFDQQIDYSGKDALGRLAQSFNQMALDLRERQRQLEIVNLIADNLYRLLDDKTVVDRALEALIQYSGSPTVAIFMLNEDENRLDILGRRGFIDKLGPFKKSLPLDGSLSGEAVAQKDVILSEDIANDGRVQPQIKKSLLSQGVSIIVSVPISFEDKVLGVMNLSFRRDRQITDFDRKTLLSIGKSIGLALTNTRYVNQIKTEIASRKKIENALRQSEERYKRILEVYPDAVLLYDIKGNPLYSNPAFTRVFGWTPDELSERETDFVPREARSEIAQLTERSLLGEHCLGLKTKRRNKQGETLDINLSLVVWCDSDGEPDGSVVVMHDMTEEKRLEAQLRQAQKMEAVGTLAGGIAHDFNNILAAISGYTELALDGGDMAKPAEKDLEQVLKAAARAKDLVGRILTFSRKSDTDFKPLDLNNEVAKAAEFLKRTIPRMVEVELHLFEGPAHILGDGGQIQQLVLNLGTNASDAMPEGGRLTIQTTRFHLDELQSRLHDNAAPGDYIQLEVKDTGLGMEEQTREHIFDPFFTTKEVGKGTGLGLAMAYGIIKEHAGHISCRSEPGRGASFTIIIPAISRTDLPPGGVETSGPGVDAFPDGTGTVLLVDDERALRDITGKMLTTAGYRVLQAASGEEALDIYTRQSGDIDLIIMDIGMPGMGGLRCLKHLLELDPAVKVMIASGYPKASSVRQAIDQGASGYAPKPFSRNELLTEIRRILGG